MNAEDKKHMTWIVFITIFLGILLIFFFKPDYHLEQVGAVSIESRINEEVYNEDFGELFDEFREPEDVDANFINEES